MPDQPQEEVVTSYKAFNADLTCTGGDKPFQYEVGKTYEMKGPIKACDRGFHACEYPLNVFDYYPPAGSRFALVEQGGKISREGSDTKLASSRITIKAEIGLAGLIKAAIEYTFSRAKPEGETATGTRGAASATGYQGAASATGYQGAASATGTRVLPLPRATRVLPLPRATRVLPWPAATPAKQWAPSGMLFFSCIETMTM
ncbi:hypothetical protein L537_3386 [Bordetella hinzii 1277]|nr:hypothetical protein L537_3386 [Bordetella hinzii 1277]